MTRIPLISPIEPDWTIIQLNTILNNSDNSQKDGCESLGNGENKVKKVEKDGRLATENVFEPDIATSLIMVRSMCSSGGQLG